MSRDNCGFSRRTEAEPEAESIDLDALLPPLHAVQAHIDSDLGKFNVLNTGRRLGKTVYGIRKLSEKALYGQEVGFFSPTYKMLGRSWRAFKRALAPYITRTDEQNKRLEFVGGGAIDFWAFQSTDIADRVRGQAYARVFLDECAVVGGLISTWEEAIIPTLTDFDGDAFFASTPKRGGGFQELYNRGQNGEPGWRSWSFPLPIMDGERIVGSNNPQISPEFIERIRSGMSAKGFAQEFLADFEASDTDLVYTLDRARTIRPAPEPWERCKYRVVGIDPGGGDPTAICAMGISSIPVNGYGEHIHQYGEFYRRQDVTVEMIAEYLSKLERQGHIHAVEVGETGGNVLTNTLQRMGWPARKAEMGREEGIEHVRWLLETGHLTISPECTNSIAEFGTYRWKTLKDGETGERFATARSGHEHADLHDARRYGVMRTLKGVGRTRTPVRVEIR